MKVLPPPVRILPSDVVVPVPDTIPLGSVILISAVEAFDSVKVPAPVTFLGVVLLPHIKVPVTVAVLDAATGKSEASVTVAPEFTVQLMLSFVKVPPELVKV